MNVELTLPQIVYIRTAVIERNLAIRAKQDADYAAFQSIMTLMNEALDPQSPINWNDPALNDQPPREESTQ